MKRTAIKRGKPLKRTEFKRAAAVTHPHPTKPRKPLPKKSPKTAQRDQALSAMTATMMLADPTCHVRSPHCTHYMTCLHHIVARSVAPHRVLDPTNVVRSCSACNDYIETAEGGAWAEACGMKKRSTDD